MSENDDKIIKSVYGNYGINRVLSFWDPSFMYKDLNLRDYLEKESIQIVLKIYEL